MSIRSAFRMPTPLGVSGRSSSITAAFVTSIVPQIEPAEDEIAQALAILGMRPDDMSCAYCGGVYSEWDHLRPLVVSRRPTGYFTHIQNLVPSCGKCNQSKGNKPWREWIESNARLSPKSRNVQYLDVRIARLEKYEEWGDVHPVDFEGLVENKEWRAHWDHWSRLLEDMKRAQLHAGKVRVAIQEAIRKRALR